MNLIPASRIALKFSQLMDKKHVLYLEIVVNGTKLLYLHLKLQ